MAEKVAEEEAAATVIEEGTVSSPLLVAKATEIPLPGGAAWLKLRMQSVLVPGLMRLGLHVSESGTIPACKLMSSCRDALPRVAVTVAICGSGIRPAVALNVVAVRLARTVTEAGTCSRLLVLASPTTIPPFGAALFNVTVQLVTAPEFSVVGLQVSDDRISGWDATRLMLAVCDAPFRLAVKVAL